jgi:hypothetical protein
MAGENIKHKTGSNLPTLPTSAQKLKGAASQQKTHDHLERKKQGSESRFALI